MVCKIPLVSAFSKWWYFCHNVKLKDMWRRDFCGSGGLMNLAWPFKKLVAVLRLTLTSNLLAVPTEMGILLTEKDKHLLMLTSLHMAETLTLMNPNNGHFLPRLSGVEVNLILTALTRSVYIKSELFGLIGMFFAAKLRIVAAHEFGHSLGLSHSDVQQALMAPFYNPQSKGLHFDDIRGKLTLRQQMNRNRKE